MVAPETVVAPEAAIVGGGVVDYEPELIRLAYDKQTGRKQLLVQAATPAPWSGFPAPVQISAEPVKPTDDPYYAMLRDEMARSIDHLTMIHRVLKDGDLDATLRFLSPPVMTA